VRFALESILQQVAEKNSECFDTLNTNGKFSIISTSSPFALSLVEG
jgi:hypothetical protein